MGIGKRQLASSSNYDTADLLMMDTSNGPLASGIIGSPSNSLPNGGRQFHHTDSSQSVVSTPIKPKFSSLVNDGLVSKFKWRPTSMSDFGQIVCKATNEIGTTECLYEIRLGGVPNPPFECSHTVKNTSAIISCQVGFHQVEIFHFKMVLFKV